MSRWIIILGLLRAGLASANIPRDSGFDLRSFCSLVSSLDGVASLRDANGNQLSLESTTANGVDLSYQYDSLNRVTNVVDNRLTGTMNTAYAFDGVGNLATLRYPNGVTNH